MSKLKAIAAIAALALGALAATPSSAWTLINWSGSPGGPIWAAPWTSSINTIANSPLRWDTGDEGLWYTVFFEGRVDEYPNGLPGLAAALTFELEDISLDGKVWTFGYEVHNASNDDNGNRVLASRVTGFSFDVNPDESSASLVPGGFFTTLLRDVNMAAGSGVGMQDVCIKSGGSSTCQGGSGGASAGFTGAGAFRLTYLTAPAQLVFTDPMVRFQGIDYVRPNGTIVRDASGTGIAIAWVPEPQSWALMILGFGAAGALLRRRRRLAASA